MNEAASTYLVTCPACGAASRIPSTKEVQSKTRSELCFSDVKPVRAVDMRGYCATIEMFSHSCTIVTRPPCP